MVYTTIVPVIPIARLQTAVFSKVCHVVRFVTSFILQLLIQVNCTLKLL